jgi:hypothetical protein
MRASCAVLSAAIFCRDGWADGFCRVIIGDCFALTLPDGAFEGKLTGVDLVVA